MDEIIDHIETQYDTSRQEQLAKRFRRHLGKPEEYDQRSYLVDELGALREDIEERFKSNGAGGGETASDDGMYEGDLEIHRQLHCLCWGNCRKDMQLIIQAMYEKMLRGVMDDAGRVEFENTKIAVAVIDKGWA